jgi:Short C-terminal domain
MYSPKQCDGMSTGESGALSGPAALRLKDTSLLGIGASVVAALAAGKVCSWAGADPPTTTTVTALTLGVPAAVELRLKSRRRDNAADIARIQRGELRRPVGLVVVLVAAVVVLLDSAAGFVRVEIDDSLSRVPRLAAYVTRALDIFPLTCLGVSLFLVASYASHYFARRPYLWTATAVGCALAIRELVVLMFKSTLQKMDSSLPHWLVGEVVAYVDFLVISMVAVWLGRRYHDAFLAKKLARMESKVGTQQQSALPSHTVAVAPESTASRNSAPKFATLVGSSDQSSAPDNRRTSDPIKQIERLGHLRDTGVLTEQEFQAKKAEILCRI